MFIAVPDPSGIVLLFAGALGLALVASGPAPAQLRAFAGFVKLLVILGFAYVIGCYYL